MKNLIYIVIAACVLVACDGFDLDDNDIGNLEALPEYIAFDAPGVEAVRPDDAVCEASNNSDCSSTDPVLHLIVEAPIGTLEDITVTYEFSGDAVFGVDFNVDGATAQGGTTTITHNINQAGTEVTGGVAFTDRGTIPVELLTDGAVDGDKQLIVTITGATRGSETLAIGRGGLDMLRVATVNIADVD